jgi:hypothetical protein
MLNKKDIDGCLWPVGRRREGSKIEELQGHTLEIRFGRPQRAYHPDLRFLVDLDMLKDSTRDSGYKVKLIRDVHLIDVQWYEWPFLTQLNIHRGRTTALTIFQQA